MANDPSDTIHLVERLRAGDRQALTDLFQRHRDRLRRMVELRMDARLQGRVDASDVIQDGFLDAAARLDNFLRGSELPAFLWLRLVVSRAAGSIYHRRHLGTKMRDAGQEVSLYRDRLPQASSAALASMLWADSRRLRTRPSGPSKYSRSRRHSTSSTRWTERWSRCGTSSSSAVQRRRRCWGSARRPGQSGTSGPSSG